MINPILKHDLLLIVAAIRATFSKWSDFLTLVLGVPLLLIIARAWVAGLSLKSSNLLALTMAFLLTFMLTRFAFKRIHYHRADGVLTAVALEPSECARYFVVVIGFGLAVALTVFLVIGADSLIQWVPGAFFGLALGIGRSGLATWDIGRLYFPWRFRVRYTDARQLSYAGLSGIGTAIVLVGFNTFVQESMLAPLTTLTALIAAAWLGSVDMQRINFMAIVGYSSWATIRTDILPVLCFFIPFALIMLMLSSNSLFAAIGTGIGMLAALVVVLRILAYRAFPQLLADWTVAIILALVATTAVTVPFAAPIAYVAAIAWLGRRASNKSWLLS